MFYHCKSKNAHCKQCKQLRYVKIKPSFSLPHGSRATSNSRPCPFPAFFYLITNMGSSFNTNGTTRFSYYLASFLLFVCDQTNCIFSRLQHMCLNKPTVTEMETKKRLPLSLPTTSKFMELSRTDWQKPFLRFI